jgi:integrase
MPRRTTGSVYPTATGYGIRWPEDGRRPHKAGFKTKTEAQRWFAENVAPGLDRGAPSPEISFEQFCNIYLERWGPTVADSTRRTLVEWLAPAREQFGAWTLRELEGAAADIARWRAGFGGRKRHRVTRGLRQSLEAARRWGYIVKNPAVEAGPNPQPEFEEIDPFSADEIDAIAEELGPSSGALAIFAAETGLRTNEWTALERRDVDRTGPAVMVRRRYARGRATPYPKTARRRVPLSDRALGAVESLPARIDTPLLFPAAEGGPIGINNWRRRDWHPALEAAGLRQRGPYQLRHTFATEALAAGVSIFELSRVMGASVRTIDRHYGHLARDSEQAIRARLNVKRHRSGVLVATGEEE